MKQVFEANTSLRRVICAVLVAIMVIGMIPLAAPKAAAAMDGKTLYIKPNGGSGDTAWYFAHFFNDGSSGKDVIMTENSDGNHYCTVPNGYSKVVIVRMNPAYSNISWDRNQGFWNKTNDLNLPTGDNNCFQATGWNGDYMTGNWIKIADTSNPSQPTNPPASNVTAYLAGSWTSWESGKITMTGTDGKNASVTVQLSAGTYTFKIIDKDGGWHGNSGTINDKTNSGWKMDSGSNCTLKASGGSYTFTYDVTTNTLTVSYSSSGSGDETNPTLPADESDKIVDLNSGAFVKDNDKLYVGTTFYDYYTDHEISGNNLDSRGQYNNGDWYIFDNFNRALSSYYSNNNALVPIYMGHFQPSWSDWGFTYRGHGVPLYGFEDGKAYGANGDKDQKYFMSVNNSNMNLVPTVNHGYEAAWGIVKSSLDSNNNLIAAGTNSTLLPMFNETFLNGQNSLNKKIGNVYHNVQFPFNKEDLHGDGIMYWVFDSLDTTLEMKKNTASATDENAPKYYLDDITSTRTGRFKNLNSLAQPQDQYGFFPFNEGSSSSNLHTYNYGFGTRLDIPFNLTADGKLADKFGDKKDIVFEFSGDDDVWVFIDGVLVLDIGGSHGRVEGSINFATMTATVSAVKSSGGNHNPVDADSSKDGYQTGFDLPKDMTEEHTLTMFYMERGMWESNMKIAFNFIPRESLWAPTTSFTVQKQWNVTSESSIPNSVRVQLQRRAEGSNDWTAVDSFTMTKPPVTPAASEHVWSYTWSELDRYTDNNRTTLYEYRVVELGENDKVLANGEFAKFGNNNMMVAYGEVYGSGATGYGQLISNNEVKDNIVVVIDFGLSVDVTIIEQGKGELVGVGNTLKLPVGATGNLTEDVVQEFALKHGVASVNGNKIRYTPTDMLMDGAENIGFCYKPSNGVYTYSTLTVIPAANIYYEDEEETFMDFEDAVGANDDFGKWTVDDDGADSNKTQAVDRPGKPEDALEDANYVYGYDHAYDSFTKYSLGSAHKVTVNADTGKPNTAPKATFSFTGTGFDVVSLTNSRSGVIMVEVKQGSDSKVSYIVDNYYGMVYDETNDSWIADKESTGCLYQVPVIKVEGLEYGTYDVTIKAAYLQALDKTEAEGYSIWLDAIRIYNPAVYDKTSNNAYAQDGESNPHLTTLKKLLVVPGFNAFDDKNKDEVINGVVFIDGIDGVGSMVKYANEGPNNETYLKNDNFVVFKFRVKDRDDINLDDGPQIGLQIGAKLAIGDEATLKVSVDGKEAQNVTTVKTSTNMFYKLPEITWEKVNGSWESCPITFVCEADEGNILSLTDLKLTGSHADFVTYVAADGNTEEANIQTIVDDECYFSAVNVMSASAVKPVTLEGKNFSLSFEDEILVNYYYAISDVTNVTEHGMLVFNTDPGAADIAKADQKYDAPVFVESDNLYACTTSGIAAKEMGDTRYYCAYAKLSDGTIVYSDLNQYSPKQYAMSRLEKSENERLKALCVAMLNYGAAAQSYFGYKTDALMNADLTAEQQALVVAYNPDLFTGAVAADPAKTGAFTATETGFSSRNASVSFEGAFALNFYFQLDREVDEVNFYYWTKEAYVSADELSISNATGTMLLQSDENGIFYAPIAGIAAKELDDTIYVAATYTVDGESFCTGIIPYSISTYCKKHANGNMGQLAQATAMYGYYAESYFCVSSQELI